MLFELARSLEKSAGDRQSDFSGSKPKNVGLSPTKSSLAEKVDGSGFQGALKNNESSEPEWEPDINNINLAWETRQVTEELWRTWNGKESSPISGRVAEETSKEGEDDTSDLYDDLPPPPPPPPLPPPPGKLDVVADPEVLSLASGLPWQGEAFNMYSTGPIVAPMWPVPPVGFYASPEFFGIGTMYNQVNEAVTQPRYWHESSFNTFGRESRRKQESLIDLAAARQHIEQHLQQQQKCPPPAAVEQSDQKQPKFCTFCGGKFQPSSKFCIYCGAAAELSAC
jgi:hypothetical protein